MPASSIEAGLLKVAEAFGTHRFVDGDCHTLAMALHQANGRRGRLYACLRRTLEADGAVYSTGYSHMVFEDDDGTLWDIGGSNADVRWEEQFDDLDVPDKWGLTADLVWEFVPCEHLDYGDAHAWLRAHHGRIDEILQRKLVTLLAQHQQHHNHAEPLKIAA